MNDQSSIENLVRPVIKTMRAYQPPEPDADAIKLHANEAPRGHSVDQAAQLNRYPANKPNVLIDRMADFYGVASANVLVTRGSSEGIDLVLRTFCAADRDNVLLMQPAFEMYQVYAALQGVKTIPVPLQMQNGFGFDIDAVLNACNDKTKVIFVCSPNNPDGSVVSKKQIERLLTERQGQSVVVVDEAYIEFSTRSSLSTWVDRYENLVVLRTLSKAFALAGARCGAVVASATLVELLSCVLPPYAVSSLVIECAANALTTTGIQAMQDAVENTIDERHRVTSALTKCGSVVRIWPSEANFILVEFKDLTHVLNELQKQKIMIRAYADNLTLSNCARISISSPEDNNQLIECIRGIV